VELTRTLAKLAKVTSRSLKTVCAFWPWLTMDKPRAVWFDYDAGWSVNATATAASRPCLAVTARTVHAWVPWVVSSVRSNRSPTDTAVFMDTMCVDFDRVGFLSEGSVFGGVAVYKQRDWDAGPACSSEVQFFVKRYVNSSEERPVGRNQPLRVRLQCSTIVHVEHRYSGSEDALRL
jgi:hypothetical protein